MEHEKTLPRDEFTVRLRELSDNPGAVRASSRIDIQDFYGNAATWTIDTFRESTGAVTAFLQRMSAGEPLRLIIPSTVMLVLNRQHDSLVTKARRKSARQAVETRRARGDVLGNPAALQKARRARRKGK
jgi:hypothetical protein